MAEGRHGFRKHRSEIFFGLGLDDPNHIEPSHEIRFYAHAIFALSEPRGRAGVDKIEPILHDGRIDFRSRAARGPLTTSGMQAPRNRGRCSPYHLARLLKKSVLSRLILVSQQFF
jgi:hypothetical protein